MRESEVVTSMGQAVWGGLRYEVQLLTSSKTYLDSLRKETRTVNRFVLVFGSASQSDRRWFRTDHARTTFMKESFSDLELIDIPESRQQHRSVESPLKSIVGEYLSSIIFVIDYLQIGFSDYRFNMYSWPVVFIGNQTFTYANSGYKDAICSLIGETLTEIEEYLDKGLTLGFKNASSIVLPLRVAKDFPGPEVAEFHGPNNKFLIIWQAGEEPFD